MEEVGGIDEELFDKQMSILEESFGLAGADEIAVEAEKDEILEKESERARRLKNLLFLNQDIFKEFKVHGLDVKFKVLKAADNNMIMRILEAIENVDRYKAGLLTLAASVHTINDVRPEELYSGESDIKNEILRKYHVLSQWPAQVISGMMECLADAQVDFQKEFSDSFLAK